jgi:predicted RNA binding protein YcfA (HicA-like mRNA interferase family)
MPDKSPRLKAKEAEKILFDKDFTLLRQKGSHRIYGKGSKRMILPFHARKILHPKIVKELFEIIQDEK